MIKKVNQKSPQYFTEEFKHQIIQAYLGSGLSKQAIWEQFTGRSEEHGSLVKWMRKLGYIDDNSRNRHNIEVHTNNSMSKAKPSDLDFEKRQLQKRISELEQRLQDAELKAIAYSTMVDVAEEMFKVPIRKKLNTKP